ncbi:MAG: DUF2283 domain-containing protein [Methanobacteriaceae archaeon]|nr:DUF2283 domain-containing protein [Methanobacteriaceae archaeon]
MSDIFEYDEDTDRFYISKKDYDYSYSIESNNLLLDMDSDNNIIGIELIDASKLLDIKQEYLVSPKITAELIMKKNIITINIKFSVNSEANCKTLHYNKEIIDKESFKQFKKKI